MTKVLVTGAAGFIGFHLTNQLVKKGYEVVGLDCINDYYDVRLKYGRLFMNGILEEAIEYNKLIVSSKFPNYSFIKLNLEDTANLNFLFKNSGFEYVCNLAAQPGVRYSLQNPEAYIQSNIVGFLHILECCRHFQIKHLVYASSSSVYGLNEKIPFLTRDNVDHPISLYAATKKSNELMAHTYSHLFNLPTTGLRFFTVYGPWGRPDMAYFSFTKAIVEGKTIDVFNNGKMSRDFTYIDDIVEGIIRIIPKPAKPNSDWSGLVPDPSSSLSPYVLYNIGNNKPVNLLEFIKTIESELGIEAKKTFKPMQDGDVVNTWANINDLMQEFNYKPQTSIQEGIKKFVAWYKEFYNV